MSVSSLAPASSPSVRISQSHDSTPTRATTPTPRVSSRDQTSAAPAQSPRARPTALTAADTRRRAAAEPAAQQLRARAEQAVPRGFERNQDGSFTFRGTGGDDRLRVSQNNRGAVRVYEENTGRSFQLTREQAARGLTIDAGAGNDRVTVRANIDAPITVRGGDGDDRIDASRATNRLSLDGGAGDDNIDGGRGDDFIQGGAGADRINAGAGSDAIYADAGDNVDAGSDCSTDVVVSNGQLGPIANFGTLDRNYTYDGAMVDAYLAQHPELVIDGSDSAQARTRADLGVMLTTDQGRGLLGDLTTALRERQQTLAIGERTDRAGGAYNPVPNRVEVGQWVGRYSDGTNQMPLPVLFHELAHAQQDLVRGAPAGSTSFSGVLIPNAERQATGLPLLDGTLGPGEALPYTDNAFRRELRLAERTTYSGERGAPTGYARAG